MAMRASGPSRSRVSDRRPEGSVKSSDRVCPDYATDDNVLMKFESECDMCYSTCTFSEERNEECRSAGTRTNEVTRRRAFRERQRECGCSRRASLLPKAALQSGQNIEQRDIRTSAIPFVRQIS